MSKPETRKLTPEQMQLLMVKPLLTNQEVWGLTGLAKSTVYGMMQVGHKQYDATFPKSFSLTRNDRNMRFHGPEIRAWLRVRVEGETHALADTNAVDDAPPLGETRSSLPTPSKKKRVAKAEAALRTSTDGDDHNHGDVLPSQQGATTGFAQPSTESPARGDTPPSEADSHSQDVLSTPWQPPSSDVTGHTDSPSTASDHSVSELPISDSISETVLSSDYENTDERTYGFVHEYDFDEVMLCYKVSATGQIFKIIEIPSKVFNAHYSGVLRRFAEKFELWDVGLTPSDIVEGDSDPILRAMFGRSPLISDQK